MDRVLTISRVGVKTGTCFVGVYLVYNRLVVIEAPGLGAERGPSGIIGKLCFRGYMKPKSISGVWEVRNA